MRKFLKRLSPPNFRHKKNIIFSLVSLLIGLILGMAILLTTPLRYSQIVEPHIQNIENKKFYELYKENPDQYLFIDVRDASTYETGHPVGAINIPLAKLYTEKAHLPKSEKKIVLICGGNSASGVGFSYLQHYGFTNIERIPGGYKEWLIAGLPYATSTPSQ